jgi:hypothetical protein
MSKRGIDQEFIEDLKTGILQSILEAVKKDNTLILEIRDGYINIYYRGCNVFKITQVDSEYSIEFDKNYAKDDFDKSALLKLPHCNTLSNQSDSQMWTDSIPLIKSFIDHYNTTTKENSEKEFQQLIVRENNILREANSTDYYIVDFEYTNSNAKEQRADLVALHWDSNADRKSAKNCNLAIIEVKYGDGALKDNSGIKKHIKDIDNFLSKEEDVENFKQEMLDLFRQKRELGLIRFGADGNDHEVLTLNDSKTEFILLLAAHKHESSILDTVINEITPMQNADLKFATANLMGYALYSKNMLSIEDFRKRL